MCSLFLAVLLTGSVAAANPAASITEARTHLAAGDCAGATASLAAARPAAAALEDAKTRSDAMAAIHFYSAQTHSTCGAERIARDELREFFKLRPGHSDIDVAKFDRRFVTLFRDVQRDHENAGSVTFDRFYPGFDSVKPGPQPTTGLTVWGASSEFQILATQDERDRWARLRDDSARHQFVSDFWNSRGLMSELARRVRFAEQIFPSGDHRGALTDRGRVFVLLGPPARVYRQALQRGQTTYVYRSVRRPLDGQIERWIYFRPQLPGSVPAQQVEFRFITQPGYGEGVMEKDFFALKALEEARKAASPGTE
jgi:GWxTD domain-containing protein